MKIANKDGYRCGESAYLIGHEFGLICVSYGNNEQERQAQERLNHWARLRRDYPAIERTK